MAIFTLCFCGTDCWPDEGVVDRSDSGGVASIMAAHELYYLLPNAEVNIFAIDPVPGPGTLNREMMSLAHNVKNYVGVYAIDETSGGFNGVVPQPLHQGNYIDPLKPTDPDARLSLKNYHLIYAPGRHGTVAGNNTSDGKADPGKAADEMAAIGKLIGSLARMCLTHWGSDVAPLHLTSSVAAAKGLMTVNAAEYRKMRQFTYLPFDAHSPQNWYERGATSSDSEDASDWHYLEDAIGEEPLVERKSSIPDFLRKSRPQPGRVKWQAIHDIPDSVFTTGAWIGDD